MAAVCPEHFNFAAHPKPWKVCSSLTSAIRSYRSAVPKYSKRGHTRSIGNHRVVRCPELFKAGTPEVLESQGSLMSRIAKQGQRRTLSTSATSWTRAADGSATAPLAAVLCRLQAGRRLSALMALAIDDGSGSLRVCPLCPCLEGRDLVCSVWALAVGEMVCVWSALLGWAQAACHPDRPAALGAAPTGDAP
eukprot:SAG31_NODE_3622_length_4059_cov_2.742905_2_plen_192_part_00